MYAGRGMASIFFRCLQRGILSPALYKTARYTKRSLFDDGYPSISDILLHDLDLPKESDEYFRLFTPNDFKAKFGIAKKIKIYDPVPKRDGHGNKIARKRAIVLPLKIQGGVIPVPFIVHTGAPSSVYFGTKAVQLLKDLRVLHDVVGTVYPYMVEGSLRYGKMEIHPLFVSPVPSSHELLSSGTLGHICCNILGMEAIELLGDGLLTGYGHESAE